MGPDVGGRIRTLKPELLEDARVAMLSSNAFRLYVGCILLSDDYGNLRTDPAYLGGAIFWHQLGSGAVGYDHVRAAIAELLSVPEGHPSGLLCGYRVRGQDYGHIVGWSKHQRVDHPGAPRVPGPNAAESRSNDSALLQTLANGSRMARETLAPDPDPDQYPDPESEKKYVGNSSPAETPSEPSGSGSCSSNPEGPSSQTSQRSAEEPQEPSPLRNGHPAQVALPALDAAPSRPTRESPAEVVWARYLECWRQHVRGGRPPVFSTKRKKLVAARLKDGLLLEDLLGAVAGIWRSQWHVDEGHTEFELCLRDVAHVEKYRDMKATNGRSLPGVSTLQQPSSHWEAGQEYTG